MRHKDIKMSIYKGDKNHWVMQLFSFLVPVRKILKNTVALDHPVVYIFDQSITSLYKIVQFVNLSELDFRATI